MKDAISISVKPDRATFVRFALFDTFAQKKGWTRPALFAALFFIFAAVGFSRPAPAQSLLIGTVLLSVGVGLPVVYFLTYLASVHRKATALKLDGCRMVYALRLTDAPDGVSVEGPGEAVSYAWHDLYGAWRGRGCTYLYVAKGRAFLLPDGQATVDAGVLWAFLVAMLPEGRAHGRVR